MSEDMSDIIKKMSEMLNSNEVPDNIKSIMDSLSSNSNNTSNNNESDFSNNNHYENTSSNNSYYFNDKSSQVNNNFDNSRNNNDNSSSTPNIDLETMLKMKTIIDSMNKQQNDPRANLLRSLKPYLKDSRKEKVDQYIKLFSMGKVFEVLNPLGGEKKHDL